MSSRLIPPNDGAIAAVTATISSAVWTSSAIGIALIPANALNRTHFPSITGSDACGPISPSPSTALPSVTTPTRLATPVISRTNSGCRWISRHGAATPGV